MRLGLLGGTFDPLHLGHLEMARAARDRFRLERLLILPARRPPHKEPAGLTPWPHRFAMAALGCLEVDRVEASPAEGMRPGPSFTVETLAEFRDTLDPADGLLFVLGADSLLELPSWRDPEGILRLASLAVIPRGGLDLPGARGLLGPTLAMRLRPAPREPGPWAPAGEIHWLETPAVAVSGTEIRERVRQRQGLQGLVPEAVARYIAKYELYRERRDVPRS